MPVPVSVGLAGLASLAACHALQSAGPVYCVTPRVAWRRGGGSQRADRLAAASPGGVCRSSVIVTERCASAGRVPSGERSE